MTDQRADKVSCLPAMAPLCHQHIPHQAVSRYSPYTLKARKTPSDGNPAWVSARNAFPPARARRGKSKHQAGGLSHPVRLLNISRSFFSAPGMGYSAQACYNVTISGTHSLSHWPISPPLQTLGRRPAVILGTLSQMSSPTSINRLQKRGH